MVKDALRGYLALASGVTEVTAARARAAARTLVEQGESTAGQVTALAEDLVATSRRNREGLALIVRHEVEAALRRLGLGAAGDVDALNQRVRKLEQALREAERARGSGSVSTTAATESNSAAGATRTGKKTVAKKRAAKKSAAKKSAAKKSAAKKSTSNQTSASSAAKRSGAKKSAKRAATKRSAKRSGARTSTATRSSARRSTANKSAASKSAANKSATRKRITRSAAKKSTRRRTS